MRRSDLASFNFCVAGCVILGVFSIAPLLAPLGAQRRPLEPQAVINAVQSGRLDVVDKRVLLLESLRISERLAVLEKSAEELADVRKASYGIVGALIANLLAQIVQIRRGKERRN